MFQPSFPTPPLACLRSRHGAPCLLGENENSGADIFCFSVGLNVLQEDALALYAYGRVPLKAMSRDLEQAGGLAGGQETTLSLSHGTSEFLE